METTQNESVDLLEKDIISDFNSEQISVPKMAVKHGIKIAIMQSKIKKLQFNGILGRKNKSGKIIIPPQVFKYDKTPKVKKSKNNSSKMKLGELLTVMENKIETEEISTLHKEMLVEILHKVIVK